MLYIISYHTYFSPDLTYRWQGGDKSLWKKTCKENEFLYDISKLVSLKMIGQIKFMPSLF